MFQGGIGEAKLWMKKPEDFVISLFNTQKLHSEVGLDGNVYSRQVQAASSSSSFEPVLSVRCLAALDIGAGVEQPVDCLITQNRQDKPGPQCAIHEEVDGLEIGRQQFQRFDLFRPTHNPKKQPCPICANRRGTHAFIGWAVLGGWVGVKVRSLVVLSNLYAFHR